MLEYPKLITNGLCNRLRHGENGCGDPDGLHRDRHITAREGILWGVQRSKTKMVLMPFWIQEKLGQNCLVALSHMSIYK